MNCKDARTIINEMLDGAGPGSIAGAEAHCETCPDCRPWRAAMGSLESALLAGPPELDFDLAAAVMARLPEQHPQSFAKAPSRRRVFGWITAAWAAGGLILAALVAGAASLVSPGLEDHLVIWALDTARGVFSSGSALVVAGVVVGETLGRAIAAIGVSARTAGGVLLLLAVAETAAIGMVVYMRRRFRGASVVA